MFLLYQTGVYICFIREREIFPIQECNSDNVKNNHLKNKSISIKGGGNLDAKTMSISHLHIDDVSTSDIRWNSVDGRWQRRVMAPSRDDEGTTARIPMMTTTSPPFSAASDGRNILP